MGAEEYKLDSPRNRKNKNSVIHPKLFVKSTTIFFSSAGRGDGGPPVFPERGSPTPFDISQETPPIACE